MNEMQVTDQVFLTSTLNQQSLGERLRIWQQANSANIEGNILFSPEARQEYDQLMSDFTKCLIAFAGCKVVASKLPADLQDYQSKIENNLKLGKWCFWMVEANYIELIVERLLSLRSSPYTSDCDFSVSNDEKAFNPFDLIYFKIPQASMSPELAGKVWTCEENIAQVRNQESPAGCLTLTALSTNQKNEDTAAELAKILDQDLSDITPDLLVEFANTYGISLNDEGQFVLNDNEKKCLNSMLNILKEGRDVSFGLNKIARYAVAVLINYQKHSNDQKDSTDMRYALGCAIQSLNLPRNSKAFDGGSNLIRGDIRSFEKRFKDLFETQANFENKKDEKDILLDWFSLDSRFKKLQSSVDNESLEGAPENVAQGKPTFTQEEHIIVQDFINNLQSNQDYYAAGFHQLCFIEWSDKLEALFYTQDKKPKKKKISQRTMDFFTALESEVEGSIKEEGESSLLDDADRQAIELGDTKPDNLKDEERLVIEDFFNKHRTELDKDPSLYQEWDKLSCKQNYECEDFVVGLNHMLLSLSSDKYELDTIELTLEGFKSPGEFLQNFNFDACSFFSIMYGSLLSRLHQQHLGKFSINIKNLGALPNPLFDFASFYEQCVDKELVKPAENKIPCTSESLSKLQLKFTVTLVYTDFSSRRIRNTGKLIWHMDPNSVGLRLRSDLEQIIDENAPLRCTFGRNLFSQTGRFKSVDLKDLSTFVSSPNLQSGAFILDSISKKKKDNKSKTLDTVKAANLVSLMDFSEKDRSLVQIFNDKLDSVKADSGSSLELLLGDDDSVSTEEVKQAFDDLCGTYVQSVQDMYHGKLSMEQVTKLQQVDAALKLLLIDSSKESGAKTEYAELLHLTQSIGLAYDLKKDAKQDEEFAIVTPYNIQSMYSHMQRIERLSELVSRMLSQIIFIDKRNVVLNALTDVQGAMLGPELIASKDISQHRILQAVQNAFGYTLYHSIDFGEVSNTSKTKSGLSGDYFNQRDLFNSPDKQIESALEIMKRYVISHPQVREHFNVIVYNCDNVTLLLKFYKKLAESNDNFFTSVKTNIYVVTNNPVTLSDDYQCFEQLYRSKALTTEDCSDRLHLRVMSVSEVTNLQSQLAIKFNQEDIYANDAHLFDVGLIFHACDSSAKFNFDDKPLYISQKQYDLFYNKSNHTFCQQKNKESQLFLVPPEQDLYGLIYLHSLYFVLFKDLSNKNSIKSLMIMIKEGTANLSRKETIVTPVPNYKLDIREGSHVADILNYVHDVANDVITFDSMLDRKHFDALGINLVEYRRSAIGDTSIFVSSRYGIEQSREFLGELLQGLHTESSNENLQKILDTALSLSGGLVMHSQIAAIYTNEMMGLVLSKHILEQLVGMINSPTEVSHYLEDQGIPHKPSAYQMRLAQANQSEPVEAKALLTFFFLLDEHASFFGSKSGEIADILVVNICRQQNGRWLLRLLILESKFCCRNVSQFASKSLMQTKATAESFFGIFSHDNAMCTLDRPLRIKHLIKLLEKKFEDGGLKTLSIIKADLDAGRCDISVSALSCVFQYQGEDASAAVSLNAKRFDYGSTEYNNLKLLPQAIQLTFNPMATETVLQGFLRDDIDVTKRMLLSKVAFREFLDSQFKVALDADPDYSIVKKSLEAIKEKDSKSTMRQSAALAMKRAEDAAKAAKAQQKGQEQDQSSSESEVEAQNQAKVNAVAIVSESVASQENSQAPSEPVQELEEDVSTPVDSRQENQVAAAESAQTQVETLSDEVSMPPKPRVSASELIKRKNIDVPKPKASCNFNLIELDSMLPEEDKQALENFFEDNPCFALLLASTPDNYQEEIKQRRAWAEQKQEEMINAFKERGFKPVPLNCNLTPNGAVFRFKGNTNFVKKNLERDIEFFKTTYGIEISRISSEVGAILISIPNEKKSRTIIPYLSIFKQRSFNYEMLPDANGDLKIGFNSKFLLGLKEENGELAYFDLKNAAPHTLIAGTSGAGKSNVLNLLILEMALTNDTDNLNLVLMDPKNGAELGIFRHLPHVSDVVYNKDEALENLKAKHEEMEDRYVLFTNLASNLGAFEKINDLTQYNKKSPIEDRLPRIIIIIDEFADWFQDKDFKQEALKYIKPLAAKGRAAGIHLILATQRPDKDVVDVQVRSNLGNQIALKTQNPQNSVIILGEARGKEFDASKLMGNGHMICNFERTEPFYAQSAYIDNDTLTKVLQSIDKDRRHS